MVDGAEPSADCISETGYLHFRSNYENFNT